jgi:hypothetical protein
MDTPSVEAEKVQPQFKVPRFGLQPGPGALGSGYFHQVSKMVTGTVRLWRVRRYIPSIRSATAPGTSRPSR